MSWRLGLGRGIGIRNKDWKSKLEIENGVLGLVIGIGIGIGNRD